MKAKQNQLSISLIILLLWATIVVIGNWLITGGVSSLADLVKDRQNLVYFIVPFLLYGIVTFLKWKQPVGLKAAKPFRSWLLLWLPVLIALGYLAFAFTLGLPSILVMFFVLLNSVRVGIEEELMFRGILFYGMLSRLSG